jgi:2,4-dienoyl-CoA reductase-like NADH-dependent reductase (Old Yellow Enzyme family)
MGFQLPGQARMAEVAQAITEAALRPPEPPPTLLYSPFQLGDVEGGLTLPNRVKLAAMTTGFASPEGLPTARLIAWYAARAAGGVGLVTVEGARVAPFPPLPGSLAVLHPSQGHSLRSFDPGGGPGLARPGRGPQGAPGSGSRFEQHRLRLDDDACVAAYLPLTEAIHRAGARAALQLTIPGVRDAEALLALPGEELGALARAFGPAAGRAQRAGFDAVEVQCTYRSLFAQLLSRATNRRRDRYGRGPGGRLRAVREALAAIREEAGAGFPVVVKYSADEYLPRGIRLDNAGGGLAIGRALEEEGAGALEVLAGAVASDAQLRFSAGVGEAVLAELAQRVKEAVGVPVLAAGRILTGDGAEAVLRGGQADLLTVGRALLADPAWLAKTRAGLELEVAPCIGCMACYTPAPDGGIGCPVNGEAGQEHLPPLSGVAAPRRVAVLGASLAGLEVARVAASRGHEVTLATDGLPLGGLLGLRAGCRGTPSSGGPSSTWATAWWSWA